MSERAKKEAAKVEAETNYFFKQHSRGLKSICCLSGEARRKYDENWDRIFGRRDRKKDATDDEGGEALICDGTDDAENC